jgi:hypothetical protein
VAVAAGVETCVDGGFVAGVATEADLLAVASAWLLLGLHAASKKKETIRMTARDHRNHLLGLFTNFSYGNKNFFAEDKEITTIGSGFPTLAGRQ